MTSERTVRLRLGAPPSAHERLREAAKDLRFAAYAFRELSLRPDRSRAALWARMFARAQQDAEGATHGNG